MRVAWTATHEPRQASDMETIRPIMKWIVPDFVGKTAERITGSEGPWIASAGSRPAA
jgi:hypothetical protein